MPRRDCQLSASDGISGIHDGLLQSGPVRIASYCDLLFVQLRQSRHGSGDRFACLFHGGYAVVAHHALHPDDGGGSITVDDLRLLYRLRHSRRTMGGLEQPQPQGIGHHEHRAHGHGSRTQHGAQLQSKGRIQDTGGNGDAQGIVEESPEQVLLDILNGGPAPLQM